MDFLTVGMRAHQLEHKPVVCLVGMLAVSMVETRADVMVDVMVDQLAALSAALMVVMRAYGLVVQ